MEKKINCRHCGATKNLIKIYKNKKTGKQSYMCNPCNTARCRKYRKTILGKIRILAAVTKYELNHPNHRPAWYAASRAFPYKKPCVYCDNPKTERHHPDITKPLEIIWLCRFHHRQAHNNSL